MSSQPDFPDAADQCRTALRMQFDALTSAAEALGWTKMQIAEALVKLSAAYLAAALNPRQAAAPVIGTATLRMVDDSSDEGQ